MENELKNSFRTGYTKGLGFGLLLILLGSVFLGLKTGMIPAKLESVVISWPMLLVFIGVVNLFKRHWISGIILVVIGKFFLVPRIIEVYPDAFPGLNANFAHIYWPLLFILAGILIITGRLFFPKWGFNHWSHSHNPKCRHHHRHYRNNPSSNRSGWNGEGFSKSTVFGSGEHIVLDPVFKGGEINAVFGGITLDLRRTTLPEGDTRLDINAVFGGMTIFVPSDWFVETHMDAVFGGFQDNRLPAEPADKTRKLVITGSCVFGGGELRN
ncbi:MAG TPA: LiaF domain-containing protein [Paludibacter sp.]|nr:LiaF domain-containing protein [Paludibacter sp.]